MPLEIIDSNDIDSGVCWFRAHTRGPDGLPNEDSDYSLGDKTGTDALALAARLAFDYSLDGEVHRADGFGSSRVGTVSPGLWAWRP